MLKLNIGFNRKIGEANYSSRGASVNLEIEVESGVVREPDKLQAKIDYLFNLAKASVDAQLNGNGSQPQQQQQQQHQAPAAANNGNAGAPANNATTANQGGYGNGSNGYNSQYGNGGNGGGNGGGNSGNGHRATDKQINFATQLAKGIRGLGTRRLDSLTGRMFGKPLSDLTSFDASSLIDTLKAIKEGRVTLDAALNDGATAA